MITRRQAKVHRLRVYTRLIYWHDFYIYGRELLHSFFIVISWPFSSNLLLFSSFFSLSLIFFLEKENFQSFIIDSYFSLDFLPILWTLYELIINLKSFKISSYSLSCLLHVTFGANFQIPFYLFSLKYCLRRN